RAHVRREVLVEAVPEGEVPEAQTDAVRRRQARAVLDAILDEMDEARRQVFVLYELERWPMAEIARAVGCPLQTAYSRLHSARDAFQEAVEQRRGKENP